VHPPAADNGATISSNQIDDALRTLIAGKQLPKAEHDASLRDLLPVAEDDLDPRRRLGERLLRLFTTRRCRVARPCTTRSCRTR